MPDEGESWLSLTLVRR